VTCDEVLLLLPDHALGTLSETEETAVRRHLRGCSACRADALALDRGVSMFASAAHAQDPPSELRERVMTTLADEWADADRSAAAAAAHAADGPPSRSAWRGPVVRWIAAAAVVVPIGGALARLAAILPDATSYRDFLTALGGKEVRVAKLQPTTSVAVGGTAILYDSDQHESWSLVEINAPGYRRPLTVVLVSSGGETIHFPFPITIDADGHGAGWLATSADISTFRTVRVLAPDGSVLATGVTGS
jgi:anti-sigma-K factor RskA